MSKMRRKSGEGDHLQQRSKANVVLDESRGKHHQYLVFNIARFRQISPNYNLVSAFQINQKGKVNVVATRGSHHNSESRYTK